MIEGQFAMAEERVDEGIRLLQAARETRFPDIPMSVHAAILLADAWTPRGRSDDAIAVLEDATRREPWPACVMAVRQGCIEGWTRAHPIAEVLKTMAAHAIPAGPVRHPSDSIDMIRGLRSGAVTSSMANGEHLPAFPALFDGARPRRSPAPELGGPKRSAPEA